MSEQDTTIIHRQRNLFSKIKAILNFFFKQIGKQQLHFSFYQSAVEQILLASDLINLGYILLLLTARYFLTE